VSTPHLTHHQIHKVRRNNHRSPLNIWHLRSNLSYSSLASPCKAKWTEPHLKRKQMGISQCLAKLSQNLMKLTIKLYNKSPAVIVHMEASFPGVVAPTNSGKVYSQEEIARIWPACVVWQEKQPLTLEQSCQVTMRAGVFGADKDIVFRRGTSYRLWMVVETLWCQVLEVVLSSSSQ